jgi:uncharacterized membrane protein HdeD (DUF308 family)
MTHLLLAAFLIIFGLNILIDLHLPSWVLGVLAVVTGVLFLAERFGFSRKKSS